MLSDDAVERESARVSLLAWLQASADAAAQMADRQSMIEYYGALFEVTDDEKDDLMEVAFNWIGRQNGWEDLIPVCQEVLASQGTVEKSLQQKAAAALVLESMYQQDCLQSLGASLDIREFKAAMINAQRYGLDMDWLECVSRIVWLDGEQIEARRKEAAQKECLAYLGGRIDLELSDIEHIYQIIFRNVYGIEQEGEIFRDALLHQTNVDQHIEFLLRMQSLNTYLLPFCYHSWRSVYGRNSGAVEAEYYLDHYREFLRYARVPHLALPLASLFAGYGVMHPHLDFNGTIARVLVDNALERFGYEPLDWYTIKADPEQYREFGSKLMTWLTDDNSRGFIEWIERHLVPREDQM